MPASVASPPYSIHVLGGTLDRNIDVDVEIAAVVFSLLLLPPY